MLRTTVFALPRVSFVPREGEGTTGTGTVTPPPGTGAGTPPPPPPQEVEIGGIKFTTVQQQKLNSLIAEERRKLEAANRQTVEQLEQLKQSTQLSDQEKQNLQARIEELQATYTTKEQQQQTEMQKLQTKYDTDIKKKDQALQTLTKQLHDKYKMVDLTQAAIEHKALRAEQVRVILWDKAVVEEALDENGKPTGQLVTRVHFETKDKDGNPVKLKLSPKDAVKAMTDMPDEYGNLFENTSRGGLGQNGGTATGGNGRIPDISNMSVEQYKQHRQAIRQNMANKPG